MTQFSHFLCRFFVVRQRSLNANKTICLVIVTVAIGIVIYRAPCILQQRSFSTNQIILTRLLNPPKSRKFPFEHEDSEDDEGADDDDDEGIY